MPGATLATSGHCAIYMRLPRVLGLNRQFHEPVFCAKGRVPSAWCHSGNCAIYMRLPRVLGLNRQFHEPVFCAYGRYFFYVFRPSAKGRVPSL